MALVPCPACRRHLRAEDVACPFCGAAPPRAGGAFWKRTIAASADAPVDAAPPSPPAPVYGAPPRPPSPPPPPPPSPPLRPAYGAPPPRPPAPAYGAPPPR